MDINYLQYYKIHNIQKNITFKKLFIDIQYKKDKIKKFIVRDGYLKIHFDIKKDLYCNYCRCNDCCHIYFIFNYYYKIDYNLIPFIFCNNFNFDFQNFDINKFYKCIIEYLNSNECCYCLDELYKKYDLWRCQHCKNLIHLKCIKEWLKQKNDCPLCKQEIIKDSIF